MFQKIKSVFGHITVEPAYFAFAIVVGMNYVLTQELYIQKVCLVNIGYDEDICSNLQDTENEQNNVQKLTSRFQMVRSTLSKIPSLTITFLAGPWTDRHGRKPIIAMALLGAVLENVIFAMNSFWFKDLRAEYLLLEMLGDCLGGLATITMVAFAYMADIACKKTRTKRMAIMFGVFQVGLVAGVMLGALTIKAFGFVPSFSVSATVATFGFLYSVFVLKESRKSLKADADKATTEPNKGSFRVKKVLSFFHLRQVLSDFKSLRNNCHPNKRTLLAIVFFNFTVEGFVHVGELDFTYLYTRKKLDFTLMDFMLYSNTTKVVSVLTQFIFIPVLSQTLKLRDSTISALDATTSVIQNILIACATSSWMLYLSVAIAFLDSSSYPILKSIISKLVGVNEAGRAITSAILVGAVAKLAAAPIFGQVYWSTVAFFPEAIFYIMAGLYVVFAMLMIYVDIMLKKDKYLEEDQEEESAQDEVDPREEALQML